MPTDNYSTPAPFSSPLPLTQEPQAHQWCRWQHPMVRDLAWVIASPPLLSVSLTRPHAETIAPLFSVHWCQQMFISSEPWLAELDAHPQHLLTTMTNHRDQRLGRYFENLFAYWLAWPQNPHYGLVAHGVPVRTESHTAGELDFLVRDKNNGQLQHWEVAIKFYLGTPLTQDATDKNAIWVGPGRRDNLQRKVQHLLEHQLALPATEAGARTLKNHGIAEPTAHISSHGLIKGRLFYSLPLSHSESALPIFSEHSRGWWLFARDFLSQFSDANASNFEVTSAQIHPKNLHSELRWVSLSKHEWLTPIISAASAEIAEQKARVNAAHTALDFITHLVFPAATQAVCVAAIRCYFSDDDKNSARTLLHYEEITRGFIAANTWHDAP